VALAGEDAVAVVDLSGRRVVKKIPVGTEPWHLALTPDGKRLAVGNARGGSVTVVSAAAGEVLHTVRMKGRNLRGVAVSPDGAWAYVPHISERGFPATRDNIDRGWVVANRLGRVSLSGEGPREAIALDPRGEAVGDVDGAAVSPDGRTVAVTAGGTHELLLLGESLPFVAFGGPDDHIDPDLRGDGKRFRRVPLGGRPLGVAFAPDGKTVVVANYLGNALQVVDVVAGRLTRTIPIGGPAAPSLARRGEAIFTDARRSFNQWYSCNTCHVEGHTNGGSFDTFNDGSYGKPKKTLSLRGVARTGPYTWHGWQKDLRDALHESLVKSMQGPAEPTKDDLDALEAYVRTLDWLPARKTEGPRAAAVGRGAKLFAEKSCTACHAGPDFTAPGVFTVGLEADDDAYRGFNPPSLRNVGRRAPFLHDGRAPTLEAVLQEHHRPSRLTGKPDLTPAETADLVAYLKSL
jgi:YVTN family beta-propeller protein